MTDRSGHFLLALPALAAAFLAACSSPDTGAHAATPTGNERDVEIVHEPCDLGASSAARVDANGDGKPDIIHVNVDGREVCRAVDLNFDGAIDAFVYYDREGRERRRESDYDRDGRPDEITVLQGGALVRKDRETNYDDKLDTWDFYQGDRLTRRERDSDGDGLIDQWWQFDSASSPKCATVANDENGDGKPDPGSVVNLCGEGDKAAAPAAPPPPATAPATPTEGPAGGPAKSETPAGGPAQEHR